ncbi:MAG: competence/damage-inducible protein A [Deltaproteobacteria bacterium]|nr:MAG: competence/damage-inducible protein A [Deltaproteobacteria bacterium]
MKAEILTIGDELLRGEIVDSNKSFLSERLLDLDIETRFHTSVADDPEDMRDAFRRAAQRSDAVLVSGGLGPTRDDLTTQVLAHSFGRELRLDETALASIRRFFERLGREMSPNNASQAYFPEGAEVLPNPIGTAPGFMLDVGEALFFCLPGVPSELRRMMDEQVLPRLAERRAAGVAVRATLLRTFGIGESNLDHQLRDVALEGDVTIGFRTAFPDNYVRVRVRAASAAEAESKLEQVCGEIHKRLGPIVYGEGPETLEHVVGRLLLDAGRTVAVAESCTGGLLAERITSVPGASQYFAGGVVAYGNAAKTALLNVPAELLAAEGAVSEPVARAMAEGVRERFATDFGLATTGISGPTGATEATPLGTVYIAFARQGGSTHVDRFVFALDRVRHRTIASQIALDWVRRAILGAELAAPTLLRSKG